MRYLAVLLLVSGLSAAFAQDPPAADGLAVIDLRPEEEKGNFGLSELEGKCNKDVFRIPDVAADPMKVAVLKDDLIQALSDSGAGKTLTVLNWSIYYNKQVQGGGSSLRSVGVGGYSIPTGKAKEGRRPGSNCPRRESAGGWYEGNELSGVYFPLISEFQGTYGGKPITARVVVSPRRKLEGKFEGGADDTDALLDAVHKTSEAVALAIAQ